MAAPASASVGDVVRATGDLFLWRPAPFAFGDELARTGLAVELTGLFVSLWRARICSSGRSGPAGPPGSRSFGRRSAELVRAHGADTLAFFKLRADKQYLFNAERTAFLGYRIQSGVLVISGEPVGEREGGEPDPDRRGLRRAARAQARSAWCRCRRARAFRAGRTAALYVGDEAIVDTAQFSLEGRPIRKVRQSVSRLRNAGYRTDIAELGSLDEADLDHLEQVAEDWLMGARRAGVQHGNGLASQPAGDDTLVVYASDPGGAIRGFLHFVPSYGRARVSLSFMRRQPDTPNGLTEFMIVEAIEHLRARGVSEVSLNFAAFARLIREPHGLLERGLGRLVALGDTWFQVERLYRFNAKFFPRWEPRYFMYERRFGLPRAGIAALWLEGQLPRPTLPGRGARATRLRPPAGTSSHRAFISARHRETEHMSKSRRARAKTRKRRAGAAPAPRAPAAHGPATDVSRLAPVRRRARIAKVGIGAAAVVGRRRVDGSGARQLRRPFQASGQDARDPAAAVRGRAQEPPPGGHPGAGDRAARRYDRDV